MRKACFFLSVFLGLGAAGRAADFRQSARDAAAMLPTTFDPQSLRVLGAEQADLSLGRQAALTMVLGAVVGEPRALSQLAASGLSPKTMVQLAETGLRLDSDAAGNEDLRAAAEQVRQTVAARLDAADDGTPSRFSFASLDELKSWAKAQPAPEAVPVEKLDRATPGGSARFFYWRHHVREAGQSGQLTASRLAEASQKLEADQLRYLVLETLDRMPPTETLHVVLSTFRGQPGAWGPKADSKTIFRDVLKFAAGLERGPLDKGDWLRIANNAGSPSAQAFSDYFGTLDQVAMTVTYDLSLAAGTSVGTYLLRGLKDLTATTRSHAELSEALKERQTVKQRLANIDTSFERVLLALEALVPANPALLKTRELTALHAEVKNLAAAAPRPIVAGRARSLLEFFDWAAAAPRTEALALVPSVASSETDSAKAKIARAAVVMGATGLFGVLLGPGVGLLAGLAVLGGSGLRRFLQRRHRRQLAASTAAAEQEEEFYLDEVDRHLRDNDLDAQIRRLEAGPDKKDS